jgi:hypothetical protein
MKIEVGLNKQSIKNAIKQLNAIKKTVPKMQQEFLMEVAHWLTDRANDYIKNSDLGSLVKDQIRGGWSYEPTANGVKIINRAEKAVYVEFGVGVVGQSQAHPNATAEGYEYNMSHTYTDKNGVVRSTKDENGMWYFWTNSNELDIPLSAIEDRKGFDDFRGKQGKRLVVGTRGAKGVWYAYNAIVDAKMELAKPNGGEIGKMWEDIKARCIK